MHLLLTDILTCPYCGHDHGLILRADAIVDRRVRHGALGCPDCRRNFPIVDGTARLAPEVEAAPAAEPPPAAVPALRIAALLALHTTRGFALLAGPAAASACEVQAMIPDAQLIVVDTTAGGASEPECASHLVIGDKLPIRSQALGAIWLSGESAARRLEDAARALHPTGRLALEPAPVHAQERLESQGLRVMLHEQETVLAVYK
jgi:uncharacterized protein YbaR (Trm112 family)